MTIPTDARAASTTTLTVSLSIAWVLATSLLVVTAAGCGLTLFAPGLLTGPPVMNGSARGTALVCLFVAVPALAWSLWTSRRELSSRKLAVGLGSTAYLAYNAVLFLFATPFNRLFLLYVAMLGLAVWTLIVVVSGARAPGLGSPVRQRWPAAFILLTVILNVAAWLATLIPALTASRPGSFLDGTGMTTNPIHVQDFAFWLPAMLWVGLGLWRGDPRRAVLGAAGLVFWLIEDLGVAVDQWMGHRADPTSDVASAGAVPMFLVLALVTAAALWPVLRSLPTARK